MCGFCGFSGLEHNNPEGLISAMMDKIKHRGPDSCGTYISEGLTLGFRRLSIVDLEGGAQPLYNEDKSLVMVFNGELYNYKELREQLTQKGHRFSSETDAETVLHLYEEHGTGLLTHLRGMFAFALYDTKNQRLILARDPFGIKPLYYLCGDSGLVFGSEIKSFFPHPGFKPEVNTEALAQYLTFQYSVMEETFFKGVFKLQPSHFAIWEKGALEVHRYHSHVFTPTDMTREAAVQAIDAAVQESVATHMVSDVEIGSFLSSGVDSSYVAACFGGAKTFTVGFDYDKYNEIEYAAELSKLVGAENISKVISTEEYWEALPQVQYHMDEPLADPSAVALYFVSREAAKHVKVTLSGEGADEFFGGYNIYREPISLRFLTALPLGLRQLLASIAKRLPHGTKGRSFFIRGAKSVEQRFIGGAYMFTPEERGAILREEIASKAQDPTDITRPFYNQVRNEDDITKMQYLDLHLWMVGDILLKADKMSMAHSLEVRVPLLDKEVFRVAARLPIAHKVSKKGTKLAFREAAAKHIPAEVAARRKLGFPVPTRIWLRDEKYYQKVKGYFTGDVAKQYFNTDALIGLLDAHFHGKKDNARKIWTVYMFLLWHEVYFTDEKV
ncbi:MAG: asparagine synthase (glutamine-hydrolyzing) [Defluviitaleaceae bacterium]|nr:asparagine synthase (glutamine-hydrolyzing) [Defluviitaleaceae bacterium]